MPKMIPIDEVIANPEGAAPEPAAIIVRRADTQMDLDAVRDLIRAFVQWHRRRHPDDRDLIDRYFDADAFEAELAGLPGQYAPPQGSLLIAFHNGAPAGCVAMRDLGDGVCEMKRMFVPESARGLGIGRRLAEQIIDDARDAGYRLMRLDTSKHQTEAMRLYERSGFARTVPYYELSDDLKDWLVFFELTL